LPKYNFAKLPTAAPQLGGYTSVRGQFSYETDDIVENQLAGDKYLVEFYKMNANDPVCGAVMLALTQIFKSIKWETQDDPKGILKQSLINAGWIDNMEDMLSFFIYGHSVMELTLVKDEKTGVVCWNDMYYRPQTTISDWKFDKHGKLTHVQQTVDGEQIDIKASKCLILHCHKTQSNPRGKSLFRNAYRDWYYKTNIEKIEAIGIERDLTGLPVLEAAEGAELTDEKGQLNAVGKWAWQMVRNVKRNSQEGLVLPDGWKFNLVGSPGQRQFDLNDVINRYSTNMALSMLAQFLVLGVTNSSGSFALAKEQSSLFHTAIEGFAFAMANAVNSQFIGGRALQYFNNLPTQPTLKPVGIERIDITDLAAYLARMLKLNAIKPDDTLENFLRDRVALPPRDPATTRVADVKLDFESENPPDPPEPKPAELDKPIVEPAKTPKKEVNK
jgi:hypothetical protein